MPILPVIAAAQRLVASCLATVVLAASASVAAAQEARPLSGRVFDAAGAALPGITMTLDEGAAAKKATTAPDGTYTFEAVAPGAHAVEIRVPGFQAFRDTVTLARPGDWTADVTMALGTVSESIVVTATREAASTPGSPGPTRIRVGGNVRPPRKLTDVKPAYPAAMRAAGREGVVKLDAAIGVDGRVAFVRPLNGFVHPDFVATASEAVGQWQFSPTLLNGAPVIVEMTITVAFRLQ